MGHSMGAAPVLSAAPLLQQKGYKIPGVIVLDVVEGELLTTHHSIASPLESPGQLGSDARDRSGSIAHNERYPCQPPQRFPKRGRRYTLAVRRDALCHNPELISQRHIEFYPKLRIGSSVRAIVSHARPCCDGEIPPMSTSMADRSARDGTVLGW